MRGVKIDDIALLLDPARRGTTPVFIADGGTNFKGGDSALQDIAEKGQINLAKALSHFNTKFQFAPPRAPHFQGLVERFVEATKATIHSAVHAHTLTDKELSAIFSPAMGRLNNVPIAYTSKTRGVKMDDIALLLDPARRGTTPLVRMARVRRGTDGEI
jgi:hypothetical protein